MRKPLIIAALAGATVLAAVLLVGNPSQPVRTAPAPGRRLTLTDLAGRQVTLRQPVERIVLVRGRDIYELALLLGDDVERQLVAWGPDLQSADRDAYQKFLARYPALARLPVLGAVFDDAVSTEAVLALKPDLVVMDTVMIERGYKCVAQMERAGLPLLFLDLSHDPFSGPQQSLRLLGRALGREERAEAIARFADDEQEKVFSRLARLEGPGPSVYLECGNLGPGAYGNTYGYSKERKLSSWGTVLGRLHCRNIAADFVANMGQINPEHLLRENPEVIVITGAYWPSAPDAMRLGCCAEPEDAARRLKAFTARPGWAELKAVRSGRVYGLFHGFCMHPTNFAAVGQLAKWLHPEAFADLDPQGRLREFHERFLPIGHSGTWTTGLEPGK